MNNTGLILNIQRLSTEDGPGIRTTVFFKGCPLKCKWCHNPESISKEKEIEWLSSRCIHCGLCIKKCSQEALDFRDDKIIIDRKKCNVCLSCTNICPTLALEAKGQEWEAVKLARELIKDKAYFEESGGGITLSGGEVMLQAEFAKSLLCQLKKESIDIAIDTCGLCSRESIDIVFPYTDLFLYDIKLFDDKKHMELTGSSNKTILRNLVYLAEKIREDCTKKLWIRTPIIPESTDFDENIEEIAEFIKSHCLDALENWELCAFNNLCKNKYLRLDREWKYASAQLITEDKMNHLKRIAVKAGIDENKVCWTGSTLL